LFAPAASRSGGLSAVQIKMESQESGETITDIQNYLETFNKEIQGGDQIVQHMTGDKNFSFVINVCMSICV
jgi:predicted Mrr-cat superfamily restriction endonuclease